MSGLRDVYDAAMYRFDRPPPSYWETTVETPGFPAMEGEHQTDVAIIGGGYAGLVAALSLSRDHGIAATVLEAGHFGWGASGRNGGFNSGLATKLSAAALVRRHGADETLRFGAAVREGRDFVAAFAAGERADIDMAGDGVFIVAPSPRAFEALAADGPDEARLVGLKARILNRDAFAQTGHGGPAQFGALHVSDGFGINPLKYVTALAKAAARSGAVLHAGSRVTAWQRLPGGHRLATSQGTLTAKRVLVAANGYLSDGLMRELDARQMPAISNIIVTRPMSEAELEAHEFRTLTPIHNTKALLHYYRRLPEGRILFGARGDTSGSDAHGGAMRDSLIAQFHAVFPLWRDIEITHFWRGLVSVTRRMTPALGALDEDPSVHFAFGCHGSGINNATFMGLEAARQMAGVNRPGAIPAAYRGLPPRLGAPDMALRRAGLAAAYLYYRARDAFENRR
jgi:glycine/D-amino acid oxidase-like deaminating enzyme